MNPEQNQEFKNLAGQFEADKSEGLLDPQEVEAPELLIRDLLSVAETKLQQAAEPEEAGGSMKADYEVNDDRFSPFPIRLAIFTSSEPHERAVISLYERVPRHGDGTGNPYLVTRYQIKEDKGGLSLRKHSDMAGADWDASYRADEEISELNRVSIEEAERLEDLIMFAERLPDAGGR